MARWSFEQVRVCFWGMVSVLLGNKGSPRERRGQRRYKRLMFALYRTAAHSGMLDTAFLQGEEMVFCKTP